MEDLAQDTNDVGLYAKGEEESLKGLLTFALGNAQSGAVWRVGGHGEAVDGQTTAVVRNDEGPTYFIERLCSFS